MLANTVDHLWQSAGFFGLAWLLATMLRPNAASIRLWVWCLAALKFVVPFGLLYACGEWLGFPVRHNAIPPPAILNEAAAIGLPFFAPARSLPAINAVRICAIAFALVATALCLRRILRELQRARAERREEEARIALNWNDRPMAPGFFKAAALTSAAVLTVSIPIVAGALEDRHWRQAVLAQDTWSLNYAADITMRESTAAYGAPIRVEATSNHVLISNINIKDLVALVYGVDQFEVFGGALPWMSTPHYDVNVIGRLHAPWVFDAYSLREPVTKYLYQQFGVSIRINGACQEPCGRHVSIAIERLN